MSDFCGKQEVVVRTGVLLVAGSNQRIRVALASLPYPETANDLGQGWKESSI